jgi:hypothetical protein
MSLELNKEVKMKKSLIVALSVLLIAGLGVVNNAGAYLTFDVDFWATGNVVNNYAKGGAGSGDLGDTFILLPGEKINVDIYFSTDLPLIGASWDLKYSPAALASYQGGTAPGGLWVLPLFETSSGSVKFQAAVFPGSTVSGNNVFFGSLLFECLGVGDVNLVLSNYLGFLTETEIIAFADVNLGTLNQVPIPGALWLLGTGLVGLVGLRRKFRK